MSRRGQAGRAVHVGGGFGGGGVQTFHRCGAGRPCIGAICRGGLFALTESGGGLFSAADVAADRCLGVSGSGLNFANGPAIDGAKVPY
jgi:hypothetical protein